jgi:hypothetical protein
MFFVERGDGNIFAETNFPASSLPPNFIKNGYLKASFDTFDDH